MGPASPRRHKHEPRDRQRNAARPGKVRPREHTSVGKQPRHKPRHAEGEHLPGRPGPLPEDEVTGERRHRAHEETGLGASGDACDHYDSGHGLEVRHPDKRRARRHGKGREHGHHGDLARCRATPFEGNEEGHDGVQNDERAGEVVAVAPECPCPRLRSAGASTSAARIVSSVLARARQRAREGSVERGEAPSPSCERAEGR